MRAARKFSETARWAPQHWGLESSSGKTCFAAELLPDAASSARLTARSESPCTFPTRAVP